LNALEFVFCAQGWAEAERDGQGTKLTALSRESGCCCRTHCLGLEPSVGWPGWSVGDHGCVLGSCAVICCPGLGAAATIETFNRGRAIRRLGGHRAVG